MESAPKDLAGRVVIITGAGQGIGRVYADHFGAAGSKVVVAEINKENGEQAAKAINDAGGTAIAIQTDVTSEDSVETLVNTVMETYGGIQVLINNAAMSSVVKSRLIEETPLADWDAFVRVNVNGTFLCSRAVVPIMRKAKWGRIINISSAGVNMGMGKLLNYVTSKAAIIGLTRGLAREVGPDGITANAVLPGPVFTEIAREAETAAFKELLVTRQSIPRKEVAEDLVGTVMFLSSDASEFLTGQSVTVDGGLTHL